MEVKKKPIKAFDGLKKLDFKNLRPIHRYLLVLADLH